MSAVDAPVEGRLDAAGRLIAADPPLADLHARAGGSAGGVLSVPQIAALARLAKRLSITVSRAAIAADGERDLDLWVRAEPDGEGVTLSITGWTPRAPVAAPAPDREHDFLRAAADWTWETDDTLCITALSASAQTAIGRLPADLIGKQLTRLFRFRENEDSALPLLNALAEHVRFEGQRAELRGGREGAYLLSGVPLIDGMGRFAGFRGGATSVVTRAETPVAGRPAAPDNAFGQRLDAALRAPIHRIVDQAERLGAGGEGGEMLAADYQGYAGDIASAGRHLLALVDDLVDLQAIERPDFAVATEDVDLADIARRAAGLLAVRAADRHVRIDGPGAEALVATGDFTRILQILVNLIGNAVRYSPEGGQVWLRIEREADIACVIVADQGKGIDAADHERIFERFERVDPSEPGGAGLGLYIARRLARAMKGELAVHSAPGQGARFTLTLPTA